MTAFADIKLAAIGQNIARARDLAPQSKVMAMLKADAYGHGMAACLPAMATADAVAVARIEEALSLRNLLSERRVEQRIVMLSEIVRASTLRACAEYAIEPVIHDEAGLTALMNTTLSAPLHVWLKLDSGMGRLGLKLSPEALASYVTTLRTSSAVAAVHLLSHFASAESDADFCDHQARDFYAATKGIEKAEKSLANSAAILTRPNDHLDWVRPGIMLYGASPFTDRSDNHNLQAAMTLSAPVIAMRELSPGESVGYGRQWRSKAPATIATIGIGYGDGYPRHAPNGTPVHCKGHDYPLVGTVSMDMLSVDITNARTNGHKLRIGDTCELWGENIAANRVANAAGTIAYSLFTGVSDRVVFRYAT